jgi:type IV fimbrial biogenesis protein FimT
MPRCPGITLPELLCACAITAVLGGLALPGASRWLADASAERTFHRLTAALALARTLAVTERRPVVLCPLDVRGVCDGDWSRGFALFVDSGRQARLAPEQQPLRVFAGSDERVLLRAFGTRRYFRFLPNGQTDWQNGRFVVCPRSAGASVRVLVVNVQGRARRAHASPRDQVCE